MKIFSHVPQNILNDITANRHFLELSKSEHLNPDVQQLSMTLMNRPVDLKSLANAHYAIRARSVKICANIVDRRIATLFVVYLENHHLSFAYRHNTQVKSSGHNCLLTYLILYAHREIRLPN